MNITLIKLEENVRYDRIAIIDVQYHHLTLSLNVKVTYDRKAIFIEMPMVPRGEKKYHLARWDSKDVSDEFQKSVIALILIHYPEILRFRDLETFKEALKKHQEAKEEKQKIELEKPKARNQSKFAKVKNGG
jgi:hypothetical protein